MVRADWIQLIFLHVAVLAGGCGGNIGATGETGSIGYQASNMFAPNGYSEDLLGPNQYRIRATGNVGHSRAVLEKLAMTRAADIGKSLNLSYFRVDAVSENITCGSSKKLSGKEPTEIKLKARRMVDIDVTFAKEAADPAWQNSRQSFDVLRTELDTLAPPPGSAEAAQFEVQQKCGAS